MSMATLSESLSVTHPELASQAVDWDPTSFSAGSNKKVLWRCEKGHEWNARIADRLRFNSGCQVCANRVVLEGFNDLATTHPILSAQAHGWNPKQVHKGMTRKVPWKCEKGHEWNAQINSRTGQGHGCPICSGRSVLVGFNDLATLNPALALEADGWAPSTFTAGSSKKVSWKCSSGHTWGATISSRSAGNGCPICSNRVLSIGVNDLLTTHPEIAREADGWDPTEVSAGTQKVMSWRCSIGHQYVQSVSYRTSDHCQGCPICGGQRVLAGFNDLATKFPEIAREADGWDPTSVTSGSKRKSVWRCSLGHVYVQEVSLRTGKQKQGCPTCSGKRVLAGFNDLATRFPEIAREADGWDPTEVSAGTHKVFTWRCSIGHIFRVSPNQRTSRKSGCPTCANLVIEIGFNDLETLFPALAIEANGWDPTTVGGGSTKRYSWKCSNKGHVWESTIINRTSNGTNCPVCVGQLVIVGVNDLATTHPNVAAQADGWDPATLPAGSKKKRKWRCELGHQFSQAVGARTGPQKQGCPYCASTSVLTGFNDLLTKFPEIASEADGWDPTTITPGSNKKMKWKCVEGHSYFQAVGNRTGSQKQGCPSCAPTGFDPNKNGWLYLIDHDALQMFQIGISNVPENRLAQHLNRDWVVIEVRGPMKGHLAQQLETAILHSAERRGAVLGHKAEIEKFDGYTEAWLRSSFKISNSFSIFHCAHRPL